MTGISNSLSLLSENYQSDEDIDEPNAAKLPVVEPKEKLPLPESIQNLFVHKFEEILDNPRKHQGRIRSFPHERDDYTTNLPLICDQLIKKCDILKNFHVCGDLHISLSRTVILRYHWIDIFVQDLSQKFKNVKSFLVDFGQLSIFCNEEKSRTFITLEVQLGYKELLNCVELVDQTLTEFKLPIYYEEPSFHLSLLWCIGDKTDEVKKCLSKLQNTFNAVIENLRLPPVNVIKVSCKIGNRLYNFPLK